MCRPASPAAPAREAPPAADEPKESIATPPRLVRFVHPEYPESAREAGASGEVVLQILVDAEGEVAESEVARGVEGHPELDEAALTASRGFGFEPGTRDGKAVASWVSITIVFELE